MISWLGMAFQTDSTRIISYCVAPGSGSNRPFL